MKFRFKLTRKGQTISSEPLPHDNLEFIAMYGKGAGEANHKIFFGLVELKMRDTDVSGMTLGDVYEIEIRKAE